MLSWALLWSSIAMTSPLLVDTPTSLIVVPTSPPGVAPARTTTQIVELVERSVGAHAPFIVRTPEQAGIDVAAFVGCALERRLACWTRLVGDSDRSAVLLVVSLVAEGDDQVGVSGLALDLAGAAEVVAERGPADDIENRLFTLASHIVSTAVEDADLEQHLEDAVRTALEEVAKGRDELGARGAIDLAANPGLHIFVDGQDVGVTGGERTNLTLVRPGARHVELRVDRDAPAVSSIIVSVAPRTTASIDLRRVRDLSHPLHGVSALASAAVAAVGASLVVVAVATATEDTLVVDGGEQRLDYDGPVAPIGLSLLAAGAVAAVGYGLFAETETYAWWWTAIGVAAGAVVLGANLALD